MNRAYHDQTLVRIKAAIAAAEAARRVTHRGLKGQLREIFIRQLLRPLLPVYIGLGTGQIISSHDKYSPQQDVVVYDTRLLPPFLADPSVGLFPIESVLYAIEVKSQLNAAELRKAHQSAKVIKSLKYRTGSYDDAGNPQSSHVLNAVTAVFAFSSSLKRKIPTETERYDKMREPGEPAILQICVAGRGNWWWWKQKWNRMLPSYPFQEILGFLSGIVVNSDRIARTRGTPWIHDYWF